MAELAVWVVDQDKSGDLYIDAMRYTRGDVIEVLPNGWGWTPAESGNPKWLIVKAPDVPVRDLSMLTNLEPGDRLQNRMLRLRSHYLDVDAIKNGASVQDAIRAKAPLPDPNVIG